MKRVPMPRIPIRPPAAAVLLLALLAGCAASGPQLRDFKVEGAPLELAQVPYVPEDAHRGGPAALAMALAAAGAPADPATFDAAIQHGEDNNDTRTPMQQAVLARGLVPSVIRSRTVDLDLVRELRAGHPAVVLLSRGLFRRYWQYAVVIGVDPAANRFVLRTGTEQRLEMRYPDLLDAWQPADFWAMVVTAPDQIPATANAEQWLQRADELQRVNQPQSAARAYAAATQRWPKQPQAWAALGQLRAMQRDLNGATDAFLTALKLAPSAAAVHADLAQVLNQRHCADQAEDEIRLALEQERDPVQRAAYQSFARELDQASGPSVVCPLD